MTNATRTRSSKREPSDWQKIFARHVVEQDQNTVLLVGGAGSGKTVATLTLIQHLRKQTPDARIFCAVPASSSQAHFTDRLQRWDPYGDVRYASPSWYRRKQASVGDAANVWERGTTYVLDESVVQRSSAKESFLSVDWDLGIAEDLNLYEEVDEQGNGRTFMLSVLRALLYAGKCKRFVATSREEAQPFSRPMEVVRREGAFIEDQGVHLENKLLSYKRSSHEAELHRALDEIRDQLNFETQQAAGIVDRTYAARRSSLYAVDQWLFHLKRLSRASSAAETATFPGTGRPGDIQRKVQDAADLWNDPEAAREWVDALFDKMGAISEDSKLARLYSFFEKTEADRICCMTYDSGTATYLQSDLQENGPRVFRIRRKDSLEEIEHTQEAFHANGGVLVVEDTILPDADLIEADATVHYDLPMRTGSMQRRRSAVIPRNGETLLTYAFRDVSEVLGDEEKLLRQYGYEDDNLNA